MDFGQFDENVELNTQISSKMSKSVPESSILIHDEPDVIKNKIQKAFCPPKEILNNSVIELARYISFPWTGLLHIERPQKYGGSITFADYKDLEENYRAGNIHPMDLKAAVGDSLVDILEPVRVEFTQHPELKRRMESMQITR
jgi:tyrosyl-tRNA synthetase